MLKTLTLGAFQAHCYILTDEANQNCVLIDPGDEGSLILHKLKKYELMPQAIFLTHGHIDHIGAIQSLRDAHPDLPIYLHQQDACFLSDPALNLSRMIQQPFIFKQDVTLVEDGAQIEAIDQTFTYWHLPGHTPGSCMIQVEPLHILFSGDVLFEGSIGRFDFPLGNTQDTKASLMKIKEMDPSLSVYPGHGNATSLAKEFAENYYLKS